MTAQSNASTVHCKCWYPVYMLYMSLLLSVNPDWMLLVSVVPGWSPRRAWSGSRDPSCHIRQHRGWRWRDIWHIYWGAYAQGNVAHLLSQPKAHPTLNMECSQCTIFDPWKHYTASAFNIVCLPFPVYHVIAMVPKYNLISLVLYVLVCFCLSQNRKYPLCLDLWCSVSSVGRWFMYIA